MAAPTHWRGAGGRSGPPAFQWGGRHFRCIAVGPAGFELNQPRPLRDQPFCLGTSQPIFPTNVLASSGGSSPPSRLYAPCIPTLATKPPVDPQWIHEIKQGYRLIASRHGNRVRLFTRRGYDWADRYPLIREAMLALPQDATIDGEAAVCDPMGVADFELLHSREHDRRAFLYAFDLLELDGVGLRPFPLERRKDQLS